MDNPHLATATHRVDSYFLPTLRFPRRHAFSYSVVSTLRHRTLSILQAGDLAQDTHTMVNLGGHLEDPSGIFAQHQKSKSSLDILVHIVFWVVTHSHHSHHTTSCCGLFYPIHSGMSGFGVLVLYAQEELSTKVSLACLLGHLIS